MKMKDSRPGPLPLIIAAASLLILTLVLWLSGAAEVVKKLAAIAFNSFHLNYRLKIAYLSAIISAIAILVYLFRKLPFYSSVMGYLHLLKNSFLQVLNSLHDNNPNKTLNPQSPILPGSLLAIGILLFFALPFIYAFVFSLLAFAFLWWFFRDDSTKLRALGLLTVLLFWSPFLFLGSDTHVKLFDNMDCHIPHIKALADSGKAFTLDPQAKLDNFLNGIPLSGIDSGYNVITWLFILFPPFVAYALNQLLMRLTAFFGMLLLLKKDILTSHDPNLHRIITGASLCFALLPFYPAGGLSIAGIPLLLYAFLRIRAKQAHWSHYLIILAFPFYSKLALAGFFIAFSLGLLWLVDVIRSRQLHFPFLASLGGMTLCYIFSHFHLVYFFLSPYFQSHREEIKAAGISTSAAWAGTIHNFLFDRVNVAGAQQVFVVAAAAIALVWGLKRKTEVKRLVILVTTCFITAVMWGFKYWNPVMPLRDKYQILNAFDFSRFYWFNPLLWYVTFAVALAIIIKFKGGKVVASLLIIGQVLFMFTFYNWEYRYQLGVKPSYAGPAITYSLSYKQYCSHQLFNRIREQIGKPQQDYRVVSLGLPAALAQLNGFYTLDIYIDVYPLKYKKKFRKIFHKELAKSDVIRRNFDENAKRCYLLSSQLHADGRIRGLAYARGLTKDESHLKIKNLELDVQALKDLGGRYIFSAVEILNHQQNGLTLLQRFQSPQSPWNIYVYQVI